MLFVVVVAAVVVVVAAVVVVVATAIVVFVKLNVAAADDEDVMSVDSAGVEVFGIVKLITVVDDIITVFGSSAFIPSLVVFNVEVGCVVEVIEELIEVSTVVDIFGIVGVADGSKFLVIVVDSDKTDIEVGDVLENSKFVVESVLLSSVVFSFVEVVVDFSEITLVIGA